MKNITIVLDGGLVQSVYCNNPDDMRVTIMDLDTEGASEDELCNDIAYIRELGAAEFDEMDQENKKALAEFLEPESLESFIQKDEIKDKTWRSDMFTDPKVAVTFKRDIRLDNLDFKKGKKYSDIDYSVIWKNHEKTDGELKPDDFAIEEVNVRIYDSNDIERITFYAIEQHGCFVTVLDDAIFSFPMLLDGLLEDEGDNYTLNVGGNVEYFLNDEDTDQSFLNAVNAKCGTSFKLKDFQ